MEKIKHFVSDCVFNRQHYKEYIGKEFYGDGPFTVPEKDSPFDKEFYKKHPMFKPYEGKNSSISNGR